jgi:hypothetical protein
MQSRRLAWGADIKARTSYGELHGLIVAAGKYQGKPAIQIKTEQYGFVWCRLAPDLVSEFGDQHNVSEIWEGKNVGVLGALVYGTAGKLTRIEANKIREIPGAPLISLNEVADRNFTAGLDPIEYLRLLHEGKRA